MFVALGISRLTQAFLSQFFFRHTSWLTLFGDK